MFSGNNVALTKKLFKAIDEENLGDFERALAEGANVNSFDKEGMTPLMYCQKDGLLRDLLPGWKNADNCGKLPA